MDNIKNEIWQPIPEWEGAYEASNLGNIRSIPRRIFVQSDSNGSFYKTLPGRLIKKQKNSPKNQDFWVDVVHLWRDNSQRVYPVGRLVLMSFGIFPPSNEHYAYHKNHITDDDRLENLEWKTANEIHMHRKKIYSEFRDFRKEKEQRELT